MPTVLAQRLSGNKERPLRSATYPYLTRAGDKTPLLPSPLESRPPILAVVIGINKYISQEYDDLNGAVGDADAFEAFLKNRLHVPASNIHSLRDEQATREAIIESFTWLQTDNRYRKNEVAMIFYYAGHGTQSQKPDEWDDWVTPTGNIEMLCPTDIGMPNESLGIPRGREDEDGLVQGIPDRTISVLLNHVSTAKGNNITVILDCCSSAGMLRSNEGRYAIRRLINPPRISSKLDKGIIAQDMTRGSSVSGKFTGMFHGSYVLLAACGREQFALEDPLTRRGLFTWSLLKALDNEDFSNLTYISLMHRIKIPERQTPHCEGEGIYWRLFNNRVSGADGSFILTKRVKNGPITLQAGLAQGITVGSVFTVHKTNLIETPILPNPAVSTLVVKSVEDFSSTLDFASESDRMKLPPLFYSKLKERAGVKHIFLYSSDRKWLESVFPPEVQKELSATIVDDKGSCDLELTVLNGRVHFDRNSELVTPWLGSRMRYDVDAEDVYTIRAVVKGSLHFYYHLTRTAPATFKDVRMELKELRQEFNDEFDIIFHPVGKNLIEDEPAKIVINEEAQLGMTIVNNSSLTLYPYLFYFDPTELTIVNWYMPPFGAGGGSLTTRVDAPLPPNSKLAIGYGDGGATPWQFVIPNNETIDLGFFRLFLSTRPAYFESILQELTPFATGSTRGGPLPQTEEPDIATWAVQTATVVQLAKPAE